MIPVNSQPHGNWQSNGRADNGIRLFATHGRGLGGIENRSATTSDANPEIAAALATHEDVSFEAHPIDAGRPWSIRSLRHTNNVYCLIRPIAARRTPS